jgi:Holliday junction DNA helicase RuvA
VKFGVCIFLSPFLPFGKIHLLPHASLADSAVQAVRLHQACLACGAAGIFASLGLIFTSGRNYFFISTMIESLKGTLLKREPTHLLIDVNGVGYGLDVSLRTSEQFSQQGDAIEISTFLYVKESIMELYGFSSEIEKQVFLKLISVSGIGPKIALRILSETTPEALIAQVLEGNVLKLTSLKGIGKKTAEVMIASLRTPFSKLSLVESGKIPAGFEWNKILSDAVRALIALGVKESTAQSSAESCMKKLGEQASTSQIISEALKSI